MTLALIVLGLIVARIAYVAVSPFGRCGACHGTGNGRGGRCPRCNGLRRQQRFGSRTVHRAIHTVRAEIRRSRHE